MTSLDTAATTARSRRRSTPGDRLRVRYAEPAEFDDVAALLLRANAEYRQRLPEAIFLAYCDNLRALALDPAQHDEREILVADGGDGRPGGLLGALAFYPDAAAQGPIGHRGWPKGWAGFRALAVDPAARGLGIGRKLAEAAIGHARAIGAPVIGLHSAPFQHAARSLYLDLGFTRCEDFDFDAGGIVAASPRAPSQRIEAFALALR